MDTLASSRRHFFAILALVLLGSLALLPFPAHGSIVHVTGQILTADGTGLPGVWVRGLPGGIVTDEAGQFRAEVPSLWEGTLEPWLYGYTFEPETLELAVYLTTQADFSATPRPPGYSRIWIHSGGVFSTYASPEDLVWLTPGIYDDKLSAQPGVTYLGAGRDLVTLNELTVANGHDVVHVEGMTFERPNVPAGTLYSSSQTVRLRDLRFRAPGDIGLVLRGNGSEPFEVLVEDVEAETANAGIIVRDSPVGGSLVFRRTTVRGVGDGIAIGDFPELDLHFENLSITGAAHDGLDVDDGLALAIRNALVSAGWDGIQWTGNGVGDISQATIVDSGEGVVVGRGSSVVIHDSIFDGNQRATEGSGRFTIDHVVLDDGGWHGGGDYTWDEATILEADPRFVDPANGDYSLRVDSPARGAGRDGQDLGAFGGVLGDAWGSAPLSRPVLQRLMVSDAPRHLAPGTTANYRPIGLFDRGFAGDVGAITSWSSSDESVLRSLGDGTFEALAVGTAVVAAEAEGRRIEMSVEVSASASSASALSEGPAAWSEESSGDPLVGVRRQDGVSIGRSRHEEKAVSDVDAWRGVAALTVTRENHSATLLLDGRVLVAGGQESGRALDSVEIYDPAIGRWESAPAMGAARTEHAAVLLGDGRVLVTGGEAEVASAEIYDPVESAWTPVADPLFSRSGHTATLLEDGRVLIVGGATDRAEIYDPVRDQFFDAGTPAFRPSGHSATRLADGRVLVLGGASAEIYEPGIGWATAAPPLDNLSLPTATLLPDGRVLAAGGDSSNGVASQVYTPDGGAGSWQWTDALADNRFGHRAVLLADSRVLVVGGQYGEPTAEAWDPSTETWSLAGDPSSDRAFFSLTLLASGEVLLVGGRSEGSGTTARCDLFVPATRATSRPAASMGETRYHAGVAALADGRVLVAGGWHRTATSGVEIYDPVADEWSTFAPLGTADKRRLIQLHDGSFLALSGSNAERYDPEADRWVLTGPRQFSSTERPSAVVLSTGEVLAVNRSGAEVYDPVTDQWSATGPMSRPRNRATLALLPGGDALVVGGESSASFSALASVERFDPRTRTWSAAGSMRVPRRYHSAASLPSGELLVVGGDDGELAHATAEIYDPARDTWRFTRDDLAEGRRDLALAVVDGKVWAIGGESARDAVLATTEVYDPLSDHWSAGPAMSTAAARRSVVRLAGGDLLVLGGRTVDEWGEYRGTNAVERISTRSFESARVPEIVSAPSILRFGERFFVDIGGATGGTLAPETHGGSPGSSAFDHPVVELRAFADGRFVRLRPELRTGVGLEPPAFADDPVELHFEHLPATLDPGLYHLVAHRGGIPSAPRVVELECSLAITREPTDASVELGGTARFSIETEGARGFQWFRDGVEIPGATGSEYVTPPVGPGDLGARYRVRVRGGCLETDSAEAILTIVDDLPPAAEVLDPDRGDYWILALDGEPERMETVVWSMSDDVRICGVRLWLEGSADPGDPGSWLPVDRESGDPSEPLASYDEGAACARAVDTRSHEITLGLSRPTVGGSAEGLDYRIRLEVTDHAGNAVTATSAPFSIVEPDPAGVRTLILTHSDRLRAAFPGTGDEDRVGAVLDDLGRLAGHPKVDGLVVDLAERADLDSLYDAWDAAVDSRRLDVNLRANEVLFGADGDPGDGVHGVVLDLLRGFRGVEYLVLVGGDDIVPMARLRDDANLLPESSYVTRDGELDPALAPSRAYAAVALAAAGDTYLSDDPLGLAEPVRTGDLAISLFVPDLALGRLVETPEEIRRTLDAFLDLDGAIDLEEGGSVLVSGYDFLTDAAGSIGETWGETLADPSRVDARWIGETWGAAELNASLCAPEGTPRVISFNGHAHHRGEGRPGSSPTDIQAIEAATLLDGYCGDDLDLSGRVIYSVGCHAGLPVPGSATSSPPLGTLDLAQTYLRLGAVAYVANSGYGWGLDHGIGYGERLVEILTEELVRRPEGMSVGRAVVDTKLRYYLETLYFDPYDRKSLMQWTFFGLPMVALRAGGTGGGEPLEEVPRIALHGETASEELTVEVREPAARGLDAPPPPDLVVAEVRIDLASADYEKRGAGGEVISGEGCDDPDGCYYRLNGLAAARGSGAANLPILPYLVYDSRLSGTSQHGAFWLGGSYVEEGGWKPVIATLTSNDGPVDNEPIPQHIVLEPIDTRWPDDHHPADPCRAVDLEVSSIAVTTADLLPGPEGEPYARHRRFEEVRMEIFYLSSESSGVCDRTEPRFETLASGSYHVRTGPRVEWAIPVMDDSEVWRVVVVVDDGTRWRPIELEQVDGLWRGAEDFSGLERLRYVVQAADVHGNVGWIRSGDAPPARTESTLSRNLPEVTTVALAAGAADLAIELAVRPAEVGLGDPILLEVDIENAGPDVAGELVVELDLPDGFVLRGSHDLEWECSHEMPLVCRRVLLGAGRSTGFTVDLLAGSDPALAGRDHQVSARVRHSGPDPDPANDSASAQVRVTGDPPPAVVGVGTVAATANRVLERGEAVDVAITQVLVDFSEPVSGAGDPSAWRLFEAGIDGRHETTDCVSPVGDDRRIALSTIYREAEPRAAILPNPGPLPAGRYRLLVCPGIEDDEGAGLEAPSVLRDFTVTARHLLSNPNVDGDLSAWDPIVVGSTRVDVDPQDAGASSTSASARFLAGTGESGMLYQCLDIEPGTPLRVGGRALARHGSARVLLFVDGFSQPGCAGEPISLAAGPTEVDSPVWIELDPLEVGASGASVGVSYAVEATEDAGILEVLLDDLVVRVADAIFADGFESGTLSAWSSKR